MEKNFTVRDEVTRMVLAYAATESEANALRSNFEVVSGSNLIVIEEL
jgi:hypothetical protein